MPDWREIARRRLTPFGLDANRQQETITELADHLEDLCEDLVRQGKSEAEAVRFALSTADDWDELRREIQHAANEEVIMNHRVKALWLPGLCASAVATLLLRLFQMPLAPAPHISWPRHDVPFVVYWGWLLCLPLVGAMGAYWSRHAGGRLVERALAASFPALGPMIFPGFIIPFVLAFRGIYYHRPRIVPAALFLLGWVVLPEAALLLGSLPFLRGNAAESRQAAGSH
jgi:hypothetical protein